MSIFFANSSKRIYEDKELNKISSLLFDKGVFNTKKQNITDWREDGDFKVKAEDTPSLTVMANSGNAVVPIFINNEKQNIIISENTSLSATVNENSSASLRNDAVILRINQEIIANDQLNEEGSNALSMVVIAGSRPDPLTDDEIQIAVGNDPFIRLANIEVKSGVNEITQNDIKDARHLAGLTKKAKLETELLRIWGVDKDPEMISLGDIWYNQSEGILKMFDGENTVAIQSQSFDWGYYPPKGLISIGSEQKPVIENDSLTSTANHQIFSGDSGATMTAQLFKMPEVEKPLIRIKMGTPYDPLYPADVTFGIFEVDEGKPDSLIESVKKNGNQIPYNNFVDIQFNQSYEVGKEYFLVAYIPSYPAYGQPKDHNLITSEKEADDNLKGSMATKRTGGGSLNPADMPWENELNTGRQWVFQILDSGEIYIGENNEAGKNYLMAKSFVAKSKDIMGFQVAKGENKGTPTGSIKASLFNSDTNNRPTGDMLTQSVISNTYWEEAGDTKIFPLEYSGLSIGSRYVIVLDCEVNSNTDNYSLFFVNSDKQSLSIFNTQDGWVTSKGDIGGSILVSESNKIVVTNDQGRIDEKLTRKEVQYLEYSDSPEYDISRSTIVMLVATGAVNLTTGAKGKPYDFQEIEFRITASGSTRTVTYGDLFESRWETMETSIPDGQTLRSVFQYDAQKEKFGCIYSKVV